MSRLFGTDGVRGVANESLTPELAFRLGRAGAAVLARTSPPDHPIVVGRDTRLSGTMLEAALCAGILSVGRDALQVGVVPTPAVAQITRLVDAAAGVMISASHNPIEDNGIKFFGADGFKLSDEIEDEIEASLESAALPRPTHHDVGIARSAHDLVDRYFALLVEAGADLTGMTIVVDAANGAAYECGPRALAQLGATVVPINAENDGGRINVGCGATDLRPLAARVKDLAATGVPVVGVAFDGDADRALFVDETGRSLSGDHVMLILGRERKARGALAADTIVGTVMSNVGLERALHAEGITLRRAAVGDRYVLEDMRSGGYGLGGEQSGHIIDLARNTTGDGPMTAVSLFSVVARSGRSLHELASALTVFPQVLVNVRVRDRAVAHDPAVAQAAADAAAELGDTGRILVRASGTEPLMRVMVEGPDDATIHRVAERVADVIRRKSSVTESVS
jgi:phosphoglucosamine mutase